MILSYCLDGRHLPQDILFFKFYVFIFKYHYSGWRGVDPETAMFSGKHGSFRINSLPASGLPTQTKKIP
jgi:hypothetical protein